MSESPLNDHTVGLRTLGSYEDMDSYQRITGTHTDEVAGENTDDPAPADCSMYFHVTFGGGDPTAMRVRDISVTLPVRAEDGPVQIAEMVQATVAALVSLGTVESFNTGVLPDGA